MGLIAAAAVAGALFFYPMPTEIVIDAKVNQNLFETYETNDVRSILIIQYSEDANRIEQFRLRRKGERWVIPKAGDFAATRIARVGEVAKSLLDRTVLSLVTEDEQGHVEFGVVDPTEAANSPNRSSLGMRVDLLDRNKADIASLIIGKAVPGSSDGVPRHYVRIPGQPAVYEIEIPKSIFKTRFEDWVDPNLMELPPPNSQDVNVASVSVNKYQIDPEKIAGGDVTSIYRMNFESGETPTRSFEVFKDGSFEELELKDSQWAEATTTLQTIANIRFIDVVGKPKAVVKQLQKPQQIDAASFDSMNQFGFRVNDERKIQSANGEVIATTDDGVRVRLLIGSLAQRADTENLDLHFHGILLAELDESQFAAPKKPEGVAEDSSENKVYLRAMEELDRRRQSANLRINELNKNWSRWIYVIPESTVNAVRPDISI